MLRAGLGIRLAGDSQDMLHAHQFAAGLQLSDSHLMHCKGEPPPCARQATESQHVACKVPAAAALTHPSKVDMYALGCRSLSSQPARLMGQNKMFRSEVHQSYEKVATGRDATAF